MFCWTRQSTDRLHSNDDQRRQWFMSAGKRNCSKHSQRRTPCDGMQIPTIHDLLIFNFEIFAECAHMLIADCWCWRRWQNVLHCMEINGNHYSIMCRGGGYRKPPSRGIAFAQTPTDAKISLSGLTRKGKKKFNWFFATLSSSSSVELDSQLITEMNTQLRVFRCHSVTLPIS